MCFILDSENEGKQHCENYSIWFQVKTTTTKNHKHTKKNSYRVMLENSLLRHLQA